MKCHSRRIIDLVKICVDRGPMPASVLRDVAMNNNEYNGIDKDGTLQ